MGARGAAKPSAMHRRGPRDNEASVPKCQSPAAEKPHCTPYMDLELGDLDPGPGLLLTSPVTSRKSFAFSGPPLAHP